MESITWFQIVAAVLAANALTLVYGLFLMQVWKATKEGRPGHSLPLWALVCGIVPPLVMAVGAYSLHP